MGVLFVFFLLQPPCIEVSLNPFTLSIWGVQSIVPNLSFLPVFSFFAQSQETQNLRCKRLYNYTSIGFSMKKNWGCFVVGLWNISFKHVQTCKGRVLKNADVEGENKTEQTKNFPKTATTNCKIVNLILMLILWIILYTMQSPSLR